MALAAGGSVAACRGRLRHRAAHGDDSASRCGGERGAYAAALFVALHRGRDLSRRARWSRRQGERARTDLHADSNAAARLDRLSPAHRYRHAARRGVAYRSTLAGVHLRTDSVCRGRCGQPGRTRSQPYAHQDRTVRAHRRESMMENLDGNAAGGMLEAIFPFEMTMAEGICAGCGEHHVVGATAVYKHGMGTII